MSAGGDGQLSLCWLTLAEAGHIELIEAAAAAGFTSVGMKLVPRAGDGVRPLVGDAALTRAVVATLRDTGVDVLEMGGIWLDAAFDLDTVSPALEIGAKLGARHFIAVGLDPDPHRLGDNLGRLCARAAGFGIAAAIEFAAYTTIRTLAEARAIRAYAGAANSAILLDALHFCRSGGTVESLAGDPLDDVSIFHLCDAPRVPPAADALAAEGRRGRLYPGEGGLPLAALLACLPATTAIEIEAPCPAYADRPFRERAALAYAAGRRVLDRVS